MCIIIAKRKGALIPKKQILKNCFNNNPDGAGFMYNNGAEVIIHKGYTTFNSFYKDLKKAIYKHNLKNKDVVMHFRIATSGGVTPSKTHPFLLSNNADDLNSIEARGAYGVAHNGVFYNYTYNKLLSDSQNYIKDFLYNFYILDKKFTYNKYLMDILKQTIGSNRLAIMDAKGLQVLGDFIEEDGVLYSNSTYKQPKTTAKTQQSGLYAYYNKYYSGGYKEAYSKYYNDLYDGCLYD